MNEPLQERPPFLRKTYVRPRLHCYGRLEDLTRTATESNNMNDMFGPAKT
jgi:hypothetical protein